jgi:hypothetical protein
MMDNLMRELEHASGPGEADEVDAKLPMHR